MIEISKATKKDTLMKEWRLVDILHYGKKINYFEKNFRFKAVEKDKLLGTIDGKYALGVVYIDTLIVAENARGKGIGTMLIKKAEEFGRSFGAHKTWLVTGKDWSENTFYKKLGFQPVGNLPDFYHRKDFVIYTRSIK